MQSVREGWSCLVVYLNAFVRRHSLALIPFRHSLSVPHATIAETLSCLLWPSFPALGAVRSFARRPDRDLRSGA